MAEEFPRDKTEAICPFCATSQDIRHLVVAFLNVARDLAYSAFYYEHMMELFGVDNGAAIRAIRPILVSHSDDPERLVAAGTRQPEQILGDAVTALEALQALVELYGGK